MTKSYDFATLRSALGLPTDYVISTTSAKIAKNMQIQKNDRLIPAGFREIGTKRLLGEASDPQLIV